MQELLHYLSATVDLHLDSQQGVPQFGELSFHILVSS